MEIISHAQAQDILYRFYSGLYQSEKHDSPDDSRTSIAKRIVKQLKTGLPCNTVLNIASGPQALEKQMLGSYHVYRKMFNQYSFFTLDLAKIKSNDLLAKKHSNVSHTQANALALPFAGNSLGMVVSNHAIDFLPDNEKAFAEAFRVLCKGGSAIFYLHHPNLIPNDLSRVSSTMVRTYWEFLQAGGILMDNSDKVTQKIESFGFKVEQVKLGDDGKDKWWEVVAQKEKDN